MEFLTLLCIDNNGLETYLGNNLWNYRQFTFADFVLNEKYQPGSPKTNICFDLVWFSSYCGTTAVLSNEDLRTLTKVFRESCPAYSVAIRPSTVTSWQYTAPTANPAFQKSSYQSYNQPFVVIKIFCSVAMPTHVTQFNLQRGKSRYLNFCDEKDQLC